MQLSQNLTFPIKLGACLIADQSSYYMWPYYHDWLYSGGFGMAVANQSPPANSGFGTRYWQLYWVSAKEVALMAGDVPVYIWGEGYEQTAYLCLTNGSKYSNQVANGKYDPNGRFTLSYLGGENNQTQYTGAPIQILYKNVPIAFLYDKMGGDNEYKFIGPVANSLQQLNFQGQGSPDPQPGLSFDFPILLLTGIGVGLWLLEQDFAVGGYIQSVAATDFSNANLQGTIFANLADKSVAGCTFKGAGMRGVNLAQCTDINQANWESADLTGVDLSVVDRATTKSSDFQNAILNNATLSNGMPLSGNFAYDGSRFIGAKLGGAKLANVSFAGCDFTGADLSGATLDGADLSNAILVNVTFGGTGALVAEGASLKGTVFTGAKLAGAHFDTCDLSSAVFGASPQFGAAADCRTTFRNAIIPAPSLGGNWSYLDLTGATITDIPDLDGLKAQYTLFPDYAPLTGIKLCNADFTGAQMYYADLTGADLSNATAQNTLLKGAKLNGANLSGANLAQAWLIDEQNGSDPNKYEAAEANTAFLINTCLDGAHCDGVDFGGALFLTDIAFSTKQASADGATMNRAAFTFAVIVGVSFRGTQLSGANFDRATLINSTFPSAIITPTADTVASVPTMSGADIRGTQFADVAGSVNTNPANMDGLDMNKAVCSAAPGNFERTYKGFNNASVYVDVSYGPTVLGTTTSSTTCPSGSSGPCPLNGVPVLASRVAGTSTASG